MEDHGIEVADKTSASRKLGAAEARKLIGAARRIYVAKGKKLEEFEGGSASAEIVGKLLGATGNLRAPTLRVGNNLLVGFNADVYERILC